ncbi:hypothetical protein THAOC_12291, partial [Thalassiosira oceanica]
RRPCRCRRRNPPPPRRPPRPPPPRPPPAAPLGVLGAVVHRGHVPPLRGAPLLYPAGVRRPVPDEAEVARPDVPEVAEGVVPAAGEAGHAAGAPGE